MEPETQTQDEKMTATCAKLQRKDELYQSTLQIRCSIMKRQLAELDLKMNCGLCLGNIIGEYHVTMMAKSGSCAVRQRSHFRVIAVEPGKDDIKR